MERFSMERAVTAPVMAAVSALFLASATPAAAQENGAGPDPDRDGNPATDARGFYRGGANAEADLDPPFKIVTFEPPPGKHGQPLRNQFREDFGVSFDEGLALQICEGQRYFQYNSACVYLAPPSGKYAALYHDDFRRPLTISFDKPVCAASIGVYPTGGAEDERFTAKMTFFRTENGAKKQVAAATTNFTWTRNTFRWRVFTEKFLTDKSATSIELNVRSADHPKRNINFLIDDIAFIEDNPGVNGATCEAQLREIVDASDYKPE